MENIFNNAYFGKTYKTRNGRIVRYCGKQTLMYVLEDDGVAVDYFPDGTFLTSGESEFDIVSEWHEEINEEELNTLAKDYVFNDRYTKYREIRGVIEQECGEAFKAGYHKANETKGD